MNKPTNRKVDVTVFLAALDWNLNIRDKDNYDISEIKDSLLSIGRIMTPPIMEELPDGTLKVLQGNRRGRGVEAILTDPNISQEAKDQFAKIDVIVYKGLTDTERLNLIVDHNTKGLNKTETVKTVLRLAKNGMDYVAIGHILYRQIARNFTRNPDQKLAEFEKLTGKERETELRSWFRGTVDQKILECGMRMGDFVREQFLLQMQKEDGKEVKQEMHLEGTRINELRKARTADKDKGVWNMETASGPEFDALVAKFKAEDAGEKVEKTRGKRPTTDQIQEIKTQYTHPAVKAALDLSCGNTSTGLAEMDERLKRVENALSLVRAHASGIKDANVQKVLQIFLLATEQLEAAKELETLLASFVQVTAA